MTTSGIYRIRCIPTNKQYVGSSRHIERRWKEHVALLLRGAHHSAHLQSAWNCHGPDTFLFEVIEEVDPDLLLEREQYWIDATQCHDTSLGYNIAKHVGGGGRPAIRPDDGRRTRSGRTVAIPPKTLAALVADVGAALAANERPSMPDVRALWLFARAQLAQQQDPNRTAGDDWPSVGAWTATPNGTGMIVDYDARHDPPYLVAVGEVEGWCAAGELEPILTRPVICDTM